MRQLNTIYKKGPKGLTFSKYWPIWLSQKSIKHPYLPKFRSPNSRIFVKKRKIWGSQILDESNSRLTGKRGT